MAMWVVFLMWVPISLCRFRRYLMRVANLVNFISSGVGQPFAGMLAKAAVLVGMIALGSLIPVSAQTTLFNCPSFSATGACSTNVAGNPGNFIVRNGGGLSGSVINFVPANSGHNGYGLAYYKPVNVQSFVTTFTFIPNGQNISFIVQNSTTNPGYTGNIFSSGAGCEGGFYQAFGVAPTNMFALEFDSGSWLNEASAAFTYSSVQIYHTDQSPCIPNDGGPNYVAINKISTRPVPLNAPVNAQYKTTGHVYSATVSYDGSTLSLSMYDVTAGGACPGNRCFTHSWPKVDIPSLVAGPTAYVGFAAGINIPDLPTLWVHSWNYANGTSTQATAPVFSVAAGSFSSTQNVALSSTSPRAIICYNTTGAPATNGASGCANGTLYKGAVPVSFNQTLYAVAGGAGYGDSPVASAVYSITTVATPTFSPPAGAYSSEQSVILSDATSGAIIYYTTDGTNPTPSSTNYTAPITVNSTQTLRAIATAAGDTNSAVASAVYTLPASAKPAVSRTKTIWLAFLLWIPISLYCFRRYPIRVAILINFIAGWGLLPSAPFTPSNASFPYWILGTCLWSGHFFTKASLTGMTSLLGLLLVDRNFFRRVQFTLWDLPMVVWCLIPLLSGLGGSQPVLDVLGSEIYQIFAWGVPYLAGRLFFQDTDSLTVSAKAFVVAGLAYVPVCVVEFFIGPQLYAHVYGYQPYRWVGAVRSIGFRPIGFLEDGNQLGVWMATSTLLAIWLWRRRLVSAIFGIPVPLISVILFLVTLLCQSWGSIVLLFGLLLFAVVQARLARLILAAMLLVAIAAGITFRLANILSLRSLVEHSHAASANDGFLKKVQRSNFGWRVSQDEDHVTAALEAPVLGTGQWDWWRQSASRPWSLWLLAFGMYGVVGLLALQCLQFLPVGRILWAPFARGAIEGLELRTALAVVILLSAIDNLLNGSMILPLVVVIGGLSAPGVARAAKLTKRGQRGGTRRAFEPASRSRRRAAAEVRQFVPAEPPMPPSMPPSRPR